MVRLALADRKGMEELFASERFDKVVLVAFPHSHGRMVGFVMGASRAVEDGQPLVCVYIPFGIFPPSGYTMVFPAERVVETDWTTKEAWKFLLSGGLTVPAQLPFAVPPPAERSATSEVEA